MWRSYRCEHMYTYYDCENRIMLVLHVHASSIYSIDAFLRLARSFLTSFEPPSLASASLSMSGGRAGERATDRPTACIVSHCGVKG